MTKTRYQIVRNLTAHPLQVQHMFTLNEITLCDENMVIPTWSALKFFDIIGPWSHT